MGGPADIERLRLSAEDARILALEEGHVVGHTCKVVVLDGALGVERVREHLAARLDGEPLLRVRLADAGEPAWERDPTLALERQVHDGGTVAGAELAATAGELMATRLPRDRPLWAIDVLALDGGRTALVSRIHHALADGMTTMRMARSVLFDAGSEADREGLSRPAPADAPARSRLAPLRDALHVPAALHRELARRGVETPLDAEPGARREVAFADAALDEVKRIGHSAPRRATVNDVVLAAVSAGVRDWLAGLDAHPDALRVKVPVSLHHPGDGAGNRDSFIAVELPLAEDDPLDRLAAIAAETSARKTGHDADSVDAFFRDLSHLSGSLERFAEHWAMSPRVFALSVSNVPGPPGPLSVAGVPVASLHSLAEIAHRHALRVAVVSAGGRLGFGLCADAEAIGSPRPIAAGIAAELARLGEAVG